MRVKDQMGTGQVGALRSAVDEMGVGQDRPRKVGPDQMALFKSDPVQVGVEQIRAAQVGVDHAASLGGALQVGAVQVRILRGLALLEVGEAQFAPFRLAPCKSTPLQRLAPLKSQFRRSALGR